jgi:post-segregation antitoxin (ccd killing protein)
MGSSPTRLPVLNVSRAATGAMAVEVRRAAERLPYP